MKLPKRIIARRLKVEILGLGRVMAGDNTNLEVRLDKSIALEVGSHFALPEGGMRVDFGVVTGVIE